MTFPILTVDEDDRPLTVRPSEEVWAQGLLHRIVRVMVKDTEGRILLQRRSAHVDLFPNTWDHSAAGHVDEGETYEQAARREAAEEIGLKNAQLKEIASWRTNDDVNGRILNRFNKLYEAQVNTSDFTLDAGEVSSVKWFTLGEIKRMMKEQPEELTPGLIQVIEDYYLKPAA